MICPYVVLFCSIGLNCALGADLMRPYIQRLADIAECFVHAYPNAGLPNLMGGYDQTPEDFTDMIKDFTANRLLNFVGGAFYYICSTPALPERHVTMFELRLSCDLTNTHKKTAFSHL